MKKKSAQFSDQDESLYTIYDEVSTDRTAAIGFLRKSIGENLPVMAFHGKVHQAKTPM